MTILRVLALLPLFLTMLPAVSSAQSDQSAPGSGFIYATVTWPSGESKTGYLRWADEEAFWDDLFHCGYRDLVWGEYADLEKLRKQRRAEYYKTHGLLARLIYAVEKDGDNPLGWRMFLSRFGDLRSIEIRDGADDFAVTADGARHEIGGYANDAGSRLYLYVAGEERERIRWNDLSEIVFSQAPAGSVPYAERLYGRVETTHGAYEGFIQWDKSECTTLDILNGNEARQKVELPMGEIRTITRARDNSVEVVTKEGAVHHLDGSNDVDSGNRGVVVEVVDLGRVTVPWNRFQSVTFSGGNGSGPGRAAYTNADALRGRVTDANGQVLTGRLVFDLDEAWQWDIYNGADSQGLEYDIPFHNLARIEPQQQNRCRVTLGSGQVLDLAENQDTGEDNPGVLVFTAEGAEPDHLTWLEIRSIEILYK